jgi:hypothetical protein
MSWIYPREPVNGAQEIDFADRLVRGVDVIGQERRLALCGVGQPMSPGDWTLYLQRLVYIDDTAPGTAVAIKGWTVQSGTDKGRADILGLESATSASDRTRSLSNMNRGVAIHVAAGCIDVGIRYVPNDRIRDDRLLAWVAPGRPTKYRIPGHAFTRFPVPPAPVTDRLRIPTFATRITVDIDENANIIAPTIIWWTSTTPFATTRLPAPGAGSTHVERLVPDEATHVSFYDQGPGAADNQPLRFEWECVG